MRVAAGVAHLSLPSVRHIVSMTVLLFERLLQLLSGLRLCSFSLYVFTLQNLL